MENKILVMSFGSDAGGIEKSLIEFLRLLVAEDQSVDLFLWRKPGTLFQQIPDEVNILTDELYPGSLRSLSRGNLLKNIVHVMWYISFRVAQRLGYPVKVFKKIPKQYDIAISYCQNGFSPQYVIDKVNAKKKIMWYHHGSYEKAGRLKNIDRAYYSKYDQFVTVSDANRRMLEEAFPELCGKIISINNLLNEQEIMERADEEMEDVSSKGHRIVTVGRISPEKGQLFALDAAKQLREAGLDFTWIFVGDGSDLAECKRKARELEIDDRCLFIGTRPNPYPYIKWADIYVQPSYVEADPVAISEALVLEKVIVASDIPAIREKLRDGELGCLCKQDAAEFGKKIIDLLRDDVVKERYCRAVHERASANEISKKEIKELLKVN